MNNSTIAALLLMLFSVACSDRNAASSELTAREVSNDKQHNFVIHQHCFDIKMEKWFDAFNEFQAQGYSMKEADQMALALAEQEYEACFNVLTVQTASISHAH